VWPSACWELQRPPDHSLAARDWLTTEFETNVVPPAADWNHWQHYSTLGYILTPSFDAGLRVNSVQRQRSTEITRRLTAAATASLFTMLITARCCVQPCCCKHCRSARLALCQSIVHRPHRRVRSRRTPTAAVWWPPRSQYRVPIGRSPAKFLHGCQRMTTVQNGEEILPKVLVSRAHERYRRQTDLR